MTSIVGAVGRPVSIVMLPEQADRDERPALSIAKTLNEYVAPVVPVNSTDVAIVEDPAPMLPIEDMEMEPTPVAAMSTGVPPQFAAA